MENIDWNKELPRMVLAALVTLAAAVFLAKRGAGKWVTAGASGAVGSLVAVAVIA